MTFEDRVRSSFAAQSMMATLGAKVESVTEGRVTVIAPILPGARQQQDFGHAALTFALGDTAAGYAALTTMPEGLEVVTAEMKINLIAPAIGDRLIAEGRVEKSGRRLVIVTARVWAEASDGRREVAILQGTMVPVPVCGGAG